MFPKKNIYDDMIGNASPDVLRYMKEHYGDPRRFFEENEVEAYSPKPQKPKKKGTVIIYRGLPGSGKSTSITKTFPNASVCSADHHFYGEDGEYNFKPWELPMAHQECYYNFVNLLFAEEELVIVDNTNMCRWEYMNYALLAQKMEYKVKIVCMSAGLHDDTSIKTLAKRNKHGVDIETIGKMKARYEPEYGEDIV
jgi:predicted kinase